MRSVFGIYTNVGSVLVNCRRYNLSSSPSCSYRSTDMADSSDITTQPSKRFRKGTHSCVECRRRKRRCVRPSDAQKCKLCAARGNQCLERKYGNFRHPSSRKTTMKERIYKLERILGRILAAGGIVDLPPNFDL